MTLGTGVALSTWMQVRRAGIWPSLPPTMNSLLAVSSVPLTPPNVEQATNSAMIQAIEPYSLLEKVTATASEPSTSDTESVVWKETMVKK